MWYLAGATFTLLLLVTWIVLKLPREDPLFTIKRTILLLIAAVIWPVTLTLVFVSVVELGYK